MTATYWEVGRRIVEFEQGGKRRAEYGEELIERLARDLAERHGRGFSRQNVWNMRQFFIAFPFQKILQTVSGESGAPEIHPQASVKSPAPISATLSRISPDDTLVLLRTLAARFPLPWSHYVKLLTVKDENARRFYEGEALRGDRNLRRIFIHRGMKRHLRLAIEIEVRRLRRNVWRVRAEESDREEKRAVFLLRATLQNPLSIGGIFRIGVMLVALRRGIPAQRSSKLSGRERGDFRLFFQPVHACGRRRC
jgi:hypothetical protein